MRVVTLLLAALISLPAVALAGPFDALQTTTNPAHTPVISAPDTVKAGEPFDVTITIGAKNHPSETGHFIRYISLYADDVELGRVSLTPTLTRPVVTLRVALDHSVTLRALSAPNHSAAWVSEHKISVK